MQKTTPIILGPCPIGNHCSHVFDGIANPYTTAYTNNDLWDVIAKMNWTNSSDRIVNRGAIIVLLHSHKQLLTELRDYYQTLANNLVAACDVFDKYEVEPDCRYIIASHIIALGRNTYDAVMECPELIEFYIENREFQNFVLLLDTVIKN